ncbi:MAG: SPOR domain-containing protein [Sulfurisoma sp.]|nr:SPOR domain-containing protein [Sulfurisoma sp.]
MSELNREPAAPPDDEGALRKRLLNRIAIAGVVVVALLGSLAVFDALYVQPRPRHPIAKAPPVAEPVKEETPSPPVAEPRKEAATEPAKEPAKEAAKEPEPPAAPEHTASVQTRPQKPLTPPATVRPAMVKPSEPLATVKPDPGREITRARPITPTSPGPLSKPLSQAVQAIRQYVLQMGVFNNLANAEELRAKLELNGIPAQIEARVQVGPFKTREEADAAREKLRALGLDSGILTAIRK